MKNTLTQRLVMGLLALFLLSYVGYQAWRYFTSQYKTETVYTYTVAETAGITASPCARNSCLTTGSARAWRPT